MAISAVHHFLIRNLASHGLLPRGGAVLEIGEGNWYNDIPAATLLEDIEQFVPEPERRAALTARLNELIANDGRSLLFDVAKVFDEIFYAPSELQAIDFEGTALAQKLDLNYPVQLNRKFDLVINHGTAEHVFNIAQVFKTIHEYTSPGGKMIHESPFTGWVDHGFFTLQPTLFFDLAEHNGYMLCGMFVVDIAAKSLEQIHSRETIYELTRAKRLPENGVLFTVLKQSDAPGEFRVPIQGYYRNSLPESGRKAWNELR